MMPLSRHTAYGLQIASEISWPLLAPGAEGPADVMVKVGRGPRPNPADFCAPVYRSAGQNAAGIPYLDVAMANAEGGSPWLIRHHGEAGSIDFLLDAGKSITVWRDAQVAPCDLAAYFTGPVLGHLLRMRGQVALHGGFISRRGQGMGVLAGKGGGKSTLVAALAKAGVAVLADDVGALTRDGHGGWQVASGYPCLRVWDDTRAAVGFRPDELAGPVVTFEAKHYVALDEVPLRFEANARPLRALVVLGERRHREDAVIERLAPGPAIAALLANVYAPRAGGIAMRGQDLACAAELSHSITICRISLPEGIGWLRQHAARLLDRVLDHG